MNHTNNTNPMKVTKIVKENNGKGKKLRVASYSRVSADKDAAFHSLEAQVSYYTNLINSHSEWELVGNYADNAISGTRTDRPEFMRLISDAKKHKMDLIITKSITRFARNTETLLTTIRELKRLGINVYFEKENIYSISSDGELLITLLAMYAEEEARSASLNQKWRIRKKFEQGQTTTGRMLGYRLKDNKLTIVPDEAEIVRYIFNEFIRTQNITHIVKSLNDNNIPPRYSKVWSTSTIRKILANEKYTGDMILQKYYVPDFKTKKRVKNDGTAPMYLARDTHEAIITKETFLRVQEILKQRSEQYSNDIKGDNTTSLSSNNTGFRLKPFTSTIKPLFSGLLVCSICNSHYIRSSSGAGKYKRKVWRCNRYDQNGKKYCDNKPIPEQILIDKIIAVLDAKLKEDMGKLPKSHKKKPTQGQTGANNANDPYRVLVADDLTNEYLKSVLDRIVTGSSNEANTLTYYFKDGTVKQITWEHQSRSKSWTPEMRQKARERAIMQHNKRKAENARKETNHDKQQS